MTRTKLVVMAASILLVGSVVGVLHADFHAADPGVRGGPAGAGGPLPDLSAGENKLFLAGQADFNETEGIADGLGPRFNLDSCLGCHAQPASGGTSPAHNPQFDIPATFTGNAVPFFVTPNGPVREARFKFKPDGTPDGGVHALFVISGHPDAAGCHLTQENFLAQFHNSNLVFRIPTPTFGAGLIEAIPEGTITGNLAANAGLKAVLGVSGRPNRSGNDGTITRFGWKAQNKSLLIFSGEAYNVEMGISNEAFQQERDETVNCQFATVPNSVTTTDPDAPATRADTLSSIEKFAFFMRFLAPPTPQAPSGATADSIAHGGVIFRSIGCALCHTPTLTTGDSPIAALNHKQASLFSDLALHNMGPGLADEVSQGGAGADEFRTAPLWGLGQRIHFLHDGRTSDLLQAIRAHKSAGNGKFRGSEAYAVINIFNALPEAQKQDVLNFLRSL
jgi:CxxC motif-containing protein (DUF1111 family)